MDSGPHLHTKRNLYYASLRGLRSLRDSLMKEAAASM
jgi:hypothetical protein